MRVDRKAHRAHSSATFIARIIRAGPVLFLAAMMAGSARPADAPPPGQTTPAQPTAGFAEGQKVEVREGDTWSAATITKKEGRKFLVHYDGTEASSDEWLTADRLRTPAVKGATTKPVIKLFAIGDKVEFKNALSWEKGVISNTRGQWYFIQHEGRRNDREWVEPWRVRKAGSTEDNLGWADGYGVVRNGEGPPRVDPGECPRPGESTKDALKRQAREKAEIQFPVSKTNLSAIVEMAFGVDASGPLAPDPELKATRPAAVQPIILSGATGAFAEGEQDLFFSVGDIGIAAVSHVVDETLRVERVDLLAGHSLNTVLMPAALKCADLSPDGKLLMTHNVPQELSGPDRLDVWNIEGPSPRQVINFKPYETLERDARGIHWSRFISNDRVATLNSQGKLIVWDLKANGIWSITIEAYHQRLFLSPGRKYLAVIMGSGIPILDAQTGKTLKRLDLPVAGKNGIHGGDISLCFKPDGKELAVGAQDFLFIYDLSSGAIKHELYPAISGTVPVARARFNYCSEGYILAPGAFLGGEQLLVGLEQQMVVWRYTPDKFHQLGPNGCFAGRYYYPAPPPLGTKGKPTLVSVALPDDKVRAALAQVNFDNQMAVHPGVSVSLEVNLPDDIKEKVTTALKATLQKNGVTVADGQPIKLVAMTEPGKTREMSYVPAMFAHLPGNVPNTTKINVTELISRLTFVGADGAKLWERSSTLQPPGALRQKKDQSVADAVAEAMHPSAGFFTDTLIPKQVPNRSEFKGFGTSQWTAAGAVAVP